MFENLFVATALSAVSCPKKSARGAAGVGGMVLWERNSDGPVNYLAPTHHTLSIYQGGGSQTWSCEHRRWGFSKAICLLPEGYDTTWHHQGFVRNLHIYFTNTELESLNGRAMADPAPLIYGVHSGMSKLASVLADDLDWTDDGDRLARDHLVLAILSQISRAERVSATGLSPQDVRRVEGRMTSLEMGIPRLADLASDLSMSPRHLTRLYKATTGKTLARRQREIQILRAEHLLSGALPLADIAFSCGFSSQSHFTTVFWQETGTTPAAWRKRAR